jgi:hypothetical protein
VALRGAVSVGQVQASAGGKKKKKKRKKLTL